MAVVLSIQAAQIAESQQLPHWVEDRRPLVHGGVSGGIFLLPHWANDCYLPQQGLPTLGEQLPPRGQHIKCWQGRVAEAVGGDRAKASASSSTVVSVQCIFAFVFMFVFVFVFVFVFLFVDGWMDTHCGYALHQGA